MVPILLASIFLHKVFGNIVIKDAMANLSSIVEVKKDQVRRFTEIQYSILNGIVAGLDFKKSIAQYEKNGNKTKLLAELKKTQGIGPNFNSVFIVDNDGKMVASSNDDEQDFDYSSYDFFHVCCGKQVLSDFRLDANGNGQFFIALPLDNKYYIGVRLNASKLQSIGGSAGLGNSGEVYLVRPDKLGGVDYITTLRFNLNAVLIGKSVKLNDLESPAVQALSAKDKIETFDDLRSYDGETVLAAVSYIIKDEIGIVAQISKKEILSQLNILYTYLFFGVFILTLLSVAASNVLARSIARPIESLTRQVQQKRVAKNIFSNGLVANIGSTVEINKLAYEFNETFLKLTQKERELEALNDSLVQKVNYEVEKRTKNEMALNKIFANMPIGVALIDEAGHFIKVNEYFFAKLGYSRGELIGANASGVIGTYMAQTRYVESFSAEKVLTRRDSSQVSVYLTYSYVGEELFVAYIDITEQQELIKSAKRNEAMLIQQSKLAAMGEMIGAIAHQWRQPLAIINGVMLNQSLKAELSEVTKQEVENAVSVVTTQTHQMSQTISDFMNFFAPSKDATKFSLQDIFEDLKSLIGPSLDSANIMLKSSVPKNLILKGYKNEL
ncbi:MAG: hypothetical protein RL154_1010, partial [Pseudomonadota bacterium]